MKKSVRLTLSGALALIAWAIFAFYWQFPRSSGPLPPVQSVSIETKASSPVPRPKIVPVALPAISPTIATGTAYVIFRSPKIFAYAHGTVMADGKIFLGLARNSENTFATNQMVVFSDENDISHPSLVSLPIPGDIETMVYDVKNDLVYFVLSNTGGLNVYGIDPHTYFIYTLASTTAMDAGHKPAITSDGTYIYGITDTDPSTVFKIKIRNGELTVDRRGHIPHGHSAAIGVFATSSELYFGGGTANGFEKDDAGTLRPIAAKTIEPCGMSDDMPYVDATADSGYVYVGCESVPYGLKIKTSDLSFERFTLPGASLGLFSFGPDVFNAAQDGYIDVFPNGNLGDLHRYRVLDSFTPFDTKGQDLEPNELFYSPATHRIYLTAWLGIKGLYQVSTSTTGI